VSFRISARLAEALSTYAKANGWVKAQQGSRGGSHRGRDTGRTALVVHIIEALVEDRLTILPRQPNPFPVEQPMQVEVIQNGQCLRKIEHLGHTYVEAPPSGEYEIRITNNSPHRRLAVLAVDGINVINGQNASYDGGGYVLDPWQSTTVPGFLRSNKECARFTFTEKSGSYANQTGRGTTNNGVIGVAVFDEKPAVKYTEGEMRTSGGPVRRRRAVSSNSVDLGTAYGRVAEFSTSNTMFNRQDHPSLVITLHYAVTEKLVEMGVPMDAQVSPPPTANPFPANPAAPGFAQPPSGWR